MEERAPARISAQVLGAWLCVLLGACGGTTDPSGDFADDRGATRAALQAAHQRWIGARITDYRYSFRKTCFCAPAVTAPVRISVRGGQVVAVVLAETGAPVAREGYPTVDEIFGFLEKAVDGDAHEIRATYDAGWGYPTTLYIDQSRRIADEELRIEASSLEPLDS